MTGKPLRLPRLRCCPHAEPSSLQGSQGAVAPAAAFAADAFEDTLSVDPGPTLNFPLETPDVLNLLQCVYKVGIMTNCSVDVLASPLLRASSLLGCVKPQLMLRMLHCPFGLHLENTGSKMKTQDGDSRALNQTQDSVGEPDPVEMHRPHTHEATLLAPCELR